MRRSRPSTALKPKRSTPNFARLLRGERQLSISRPLEFIPQPWNSAVVRIVETVKTSVTYDAGKILYAALNQLGLMYSDGTHSAFMPTEFKIISFMCWNISDKTTHASMLSLFPIDFMTENNCDLTQITVTAAKNAYASCGYVFPSTHQNVVFKGDLNAGATPARSIVTIDPTDKSIIESRVHIQWRSSTSNSLPNQSEMFRLNETMMKVCHALTKLGVDPSKITRATASSTGSASFEEIFRDDS